MGSMSKRIVEAIIVPRPEPYVRKQGEGSKRLAALREGRSVFLSGYRRPGYYREQLAKEGLVLAQRKDTLTLDNGEQVKGITVWVSNLPPTPYTPSTDEMVEEYERRMEEEA
jgi:hypothetical protein